jgi:hypothetical protein
MTISDKAISAVRKSNAAMGRLMAHFDRVHQSIYNWLNSKDIRLTTPDAVRIIREETGLTDTEILEEDTKSEPASCKDNRLSAGSAAAA